MEADQADLSLEWYFDEKSVLSGAVFWKDIRVSSPTSCRRTWISACSPSIGGAAPAPLLYDVSRPINGDKAKVLGLEFGAQHFFDNGFGVRANYSWIDTKAYVDGVHVGQLEGVSKSSYSVALMFENDRWDAQVAADYSGKYTEVTDAVGGLSQKADPITWVTASVAYKVTDTSPVSLEGRNLTDEFYFSTLGPAPTSSARLRDLGPLVSARGERQVLSARELRDRMNAWLLHALVTMLLWGVWGAFAGLPGEHGVPETLNYVVWSLTMIPPAFFVLRWAGSRCCAIAAPSCSGLAIGLLGAGGQMLLFHAVRIGPPYLIFPIISLSPALTIAMSFALLKERTGVLGMLGIVLALLSLPLFDYRADGEPAGLRAVVHAGAADPGGLGRAGVRHQARQRHHGCGEHLLLHDAERAAAGPGGARHDRLLAAHQLRPRRPGPRGRDPDPERRRRADPGVRLSLRQGDHRLAAGQCRRAAADRGHLAAADRRHARADRRSRALRWRSLAALLLALQPEDAGARKP